LASSSAAVARVRGFVGAGACVQGFAGAILRTRFFTIKFETQNCARYLSAFCEGYQKFAYIFPGEIFEAVFFII
jgi:hypothetical protein